MRVKQPDTTQGHRLGRRSWLVLVLALCLSVFAAACGGDDDEPAAGGGDNGGESAESKLPSSVNVGFINVMSGGAAFCGIQEREGAELAIEQAEEENFLGDTTIELNVADDEGTPEGAVQGVRRLLNDGAKTIVGPCLGPVSLAVHPIVIQQEVPEVVTTANAADLSSEWVFRAGVPQTEYADLSVKAIADGGAEKVSVIYDRTQPSIAEFTWGRVMKPAIEEAGMELLVEEGVATDQTNFSSQVTRVVRSNPDAVGVVLQGAPNVTVVQQLREAGYDGPIWGHQGMLNEAYLGAGEAVNGTLIATSYAPGLPGEGREKFTQLHQEKYNKQASELTAHGYDSMWMVMRALKDAGTDDPVAIRDALDAIEGFQGAQGDISFTDEGDATTTGGVVEVQDGELVALEDQPE